MEESRARPVPAPRKTLTELKKTEYENVAINLINKNLIIKSENLQGDDVVDKVPNNKLFIPQVTILPCEEDTSSSKSILTETNNLHPDKNQNLVNEKPQNNNSIEASDDDELYEKLPNSSPSTSRASPRRPPELPPKTYMNVKRESVTSLGNSSFSDGGPKSASSVTLDSSLGSTGSGDTSGRYKSPSPGDLLKSIGSTSKLLTQSVGERITARAKGARSKLDKNIKTSHEFISSLGHGTSSRLKTVGKQINTFSLKKKSKKDCQLDEDRPQTLPPNDSVFESISFNSPLKETVGVNDLTREEGSYEIPRNLKLPPHPPSYEDVMKETFHRNITQTKSLITAKKDNNFNLTKTNSDPDVNELGAVGKFSYKEDDYLPMPNYPPPQLPDQESNQRETNQRESNQKESNQRETNQKDNIPVYSMVKKSEPPVKPKRKTKSIEPELRHLETVPESNRATVDSLELRASLDSNATRDISMEIAEEISWKEKLTPKPDRSESWQYFDNDDDSTSSAEPVYANQEQFYGKLSEMKTKDDLLAPSEGACALVLNDLNGNKPGTSKDLLNEFDPLVRKNLTLCKSDKTNELLLLEYLIEEDIYGSNSNVTEGIGEENSSSSMDGDSAEGDNMVIVHQNSRLNESEIEPYLAKVDDEGKPQNNVDLSRSSAKKSQWYDRNSAEGEAPPTYFEAISESTQPKSPEKVKTSSFTTKFTNVINRMSVKRKSSLSKKASDVKVAIKMIPRPQLTQGLVRHDGPLIRFPSGVVEDILKEIQNRRALLRDKRFQTYLEQEMKTPKEMIPLENITSIQCVSNGRVTDNATHYFCFELTSYSPKSSSANQQLSSSNVILSSSGSGNCKMQRSCHLYGVVRESERDIWMQKLAESLTDVFQSNYTCQFYRMGWCYIKKSITSEWSGTWAILRKRKRRLVFHSEDSLNVEKLDLRKARCIVMKDADDTIKHLHVESGPILMIDCPPHTIYMIMAASRETKLWRQAIREVAHNNGPQISDQQLTKFNVPVIVDKCINFVYIHGSMSEGIYRKSGSENNIQKLLQEFRTNAFNVEITRNDYSENDVANVLKRFMRDLPTRLLGKHSESFVSITTLEPKMEKINAYRELLSRLYTIEYETLKKLIGHLSFIHSMRNQNKMEIKNLAVIWGPTLLQKVEDIGYSQQDAEVVSDMVLLYKHIFPLSEDEIKKEQEMLMCLQRYYASAETLADSVKKSGDLKIWITIDPKPESEKEEKDQVNVTISPTKTAFDVCKELAGRMRLSTHQVTLYEVVLNKSLRRPLHHEEKVFDAILKWSYWPEEDKKNNVLVVAPIDILKEVERVIRNSPAVVPTGKELKFADNRTKSFKTFSMELKSGKIAVMKKEKNGTNTIVKEIFLHNTTVYLGCEKKRDFPSSWALTFVDSLNKDIVRTRETPFVGHVIAGGEWVDRITWFASIWYNLHGENAIPPAEIILD